MKRQICFFRTVLPGCLLPALLMLLNACLLTAQDLHVYYDLFDDSISYIQDGRTVSNPKIRRGDRVVIHFTEFNPYLYTASADVEQRHSDEWSGDTGMSAFQAFLPGMSNILPPSGEIAADATAQAPVSFLDVPLLRLGEASFKLKDLFSNSRGTEQLLVQANTQLQRLSQIQAEMAEIYQEIRAMEKSEKAGRLASKHLDYLLHNPRLRPSLIKKVALEYLKLVFPDKNADALQVDDAFQWQERPAVKRRLLQDLEAKQREFDAQMLLLNPVTQQMSDLDVGSPALEEFAGGLRDVTKQGKNSRQQLEAYIANEAKKQMQDLTLEEMMDLQLKFRELANQPFTYDCAVQVENEVAIVTATFSPLDSLSSSLQQSDRSPRVKTVKLETRGGLRINTGFGVGFSQFFDPEQSFSVRDNAIVADGGSNIKPSLSTYIHFYGDNRKSMALAGTFGLGIPLSDGNISALNFFLGPSLLFGRGQRIVLSGGLTAGPVDRLARGFAEGDAFDPNNGDIPLRSRYEMGYFMGISFNMGR